MLSEISVWALFLMLAGITIPNVDAFEFAFENYMALGYGDVVAGDGWRLIGPIMALNGLLLDRLVGRHHLSRSETRWPKTLAISAASPRRCGEAPGGRERDAI